MQCDLSLLVTLQAAFMNLFHTAEAFSDHQSATTEHSFSASVTSLSALCLDDCLPMPAWTLRISLDTHSEGFLLC